LSSRFSDSLTKLNRWVLIVGLRKHNQRKANSTIDTVQIEIVKWCAEEEENKEAQRGAEIVHGAKWSNGVLRAHLHRRVHNRRSMWPGT
jgi:hypothetical protein